MDRSSTQVEAQALQYMTDIDRYRQAKLFGTALFLLVLFDSFFNYFLQNIGGRLPVNALAAVFLVLGAFKFGMRPLLPPMNILLALVFGFLGFMLGVIFISETSATHVLSIGSAMCGFFIGFLTTRWAKDARIDAIAFSFAGGLYVIVCIIALLEIAPRFFPLINAVWSDNGILRFRPEVTTDQNFQILYLIPAALPLVLPYRFWQFSTALAMSVGSLFVLARLQTRSGFLVFAALLFLCWIAPLWVKSLGRNKLLILPLVVVSFAVLFFDQILAAGSLLITRFTGGMETGHGRLVSITYLFEHILDVGWWVPHGNMEFKKIYGAIPHSNITAMFLEGGILGLSMWIIVFVVPLVKLSRVFLAGKLDNYGAMIFLGGVASLVIQLSLNVPFVDQVWLWAGAVVGARDRSSRGFTTNQITEEVTA